MKNILKKLRSKAGESLIEVLVSILIFTFGSIALLTMCTTSVNINQKVKDVTKNVEDQLIDVEAAQSVPQNGHVKMVFNKDTAAGSISHIIVDADVSVYGNKEADSFYSYFFLPASPAPEGGH